MASTAACRALSSSMAPLVTVMVTLSIATPRHFSCVSGETVSVTSGLMAMAISSVAVQPAGSVAVTVTVAAAVAVAVVLVPVVGVNVALPVALHA